VEDNKADSRGKESGFEETTNVVFVLFMCKEFVASIMKEEIDLL
jgi:hypothetical protein